MIVVIPSLRKECCHMIRPGSEIPSSIFYICIIEGDRACYAQYKCTKIIFGINLCGNDIDEIHFCSCNMKRLKDMNSYLLQEYFLEEYI